jgi:hypothetical protein
MTLSGDGTITGLVAGGLPDATITTDELAAGAALNNAPNSVGFRNRIINGDMRIDQRNAGAAVTPASGAYVLDRWIQIQGVASKYSVEQTISGTSAPSGFTDYLGVTSLSAYASLAADPFLTSQYIEGFNVADLSWGTASAKTITISFWVRSSLTGTFSFSVCNAPANRNYIATYTIAVADTWEYKTVTIAGDTSGTWGTGNGIGIQLRFDLGSGSNFNGTAGSWGSSNLLRTSGSQSVVGTNAATWYITGVQLEVGSVATPFERRPYGTELALCQRYYYRIKGVDDASHFGSGFNISTTQAVALTFFPVSMRIAPTALEQNGTASDYRIYHGSNTITACSSVPTFGGSTADNSRSLLTVSSGLTAGQGAMSRATNSNAYFAWSAEL